MNHQSVEYAQYKAQRIKDLVPEFNRSGIIILDFGCGSGLMTNYLQEVFFEANVIGIDQSKEKIAQAKKHYPEIKFQTIENEKLGFPDNYFNVIIAADVFHHIPFEKHNYWIQELLQVLKPGGSFALLELNPWNMFTCYAFKKNPSEQGVRMLSPCYAKKMIGNFGQVEIHYYGSFLERLKFFAWMEPYLEKVPFGSFYIMVVKKN